MSTNTTGIANAASQSAKAKLGSGISVQVTQQRRVYQWDHATTVGKGDASLGGLRSLTKPETSDERLPASIARNLGEIDDKTAKILSQNYYQLPSLLTKMGKRVLDDVKENFIKSASHMKKQLADKYPQGKQIPAAQMKAADDAVNKYAFIGYEIIVTGFMVSTNNPKGSKQRSDGLFVTPRILRRVLINQPLSAKEVELLIESICGTLIAETETSVDFQITKRGRDRYGNPAIEITAVKEQKKRVDVPPSLRR